MKLEIAEPYASTPEHRLGGWTITVQALQKIADDVLRGIKNQDFEIRIAQFFLPACDNQSNYNFIEVLAMIHQENAQLLIDIIVLKENNDFVFDDLFDFIEFALGARHIYDPEIQFEENRDTKDYILGKYYFQGDKVLESIEDYYFPEPGACGYQPNKILLKTQDYYHAFVRLHVLSKTLKNEYSLKTLQSLLKYGLCSTTIEKNIEQASHPFEMRLRSLLPDKPGRETILFTLPFHDYNQATHPLKTYLDLKNNGWACVGKLQPMRKLHAFFNIKVKVIANPEALFAAIKETAALNNNHIPYTFISGHGYCDKVNKRYLGIAFNKKADGTDWYLGEHTPIPEDAFSPLANGQLVLWGCNGLDQNSDKIAWVEHLAAQTNNTTVICATKILNSNEHNLKISVDADKEIHIRFLKDNTDGDITYKVTSPIREQKNKFII